LANGGRRLDIHNQRMLQIDEIVVGVQERREKVAEIRKVRVTSSSITLDAEFDYRQLLGGQSSGYVPGVSRSTIAIGRNRPSPLRERTSCPTRSAPFSRSAENAALVLIDHQVGLMTGVRDYSTGELKHNVVALAKAAKALQLPIIVTTTARDSMWGPTFPELVEALPGVPIIDRSSVNAFDDPEVARAITEAGRTKLIFAGISLEVCAAFPAITAIGMGLEVYVAVDASGTFSETKRQVGLLRMLQAGVILSDYATLMVEILKDNARPEAAAVYGAMDMPWAKLVGQIAQAFRR
jgi:nicotinamidase-related amidase